LPRRKKDSIIPVLADSEDEALLHDAHAHRQARRIDPTAPLPGPKTVQEEGIMLPPVAMGERQFTLEGRRAFDRYTDALIKFSGDTTKALLEIGFSADEVFERADELHDQMLDLVGDNVPAATLMRRANVSLSTIVRILSSWAFSKHPGASLKSIEKLLEIQGQAGATASEHSWEARVRRAMENKKLRGRRGAKV
jgi:hypothetical protein